MILSTLLSLITSGKISLIFLKTIAKLISFFVYQYQLLKDYIHIRYNGNSKTNRGNKTFLVIGCHGGIPFWDWLVLPEGGLWYEYFWPTVLGSIIHRANYYGYETVLEFDAYTFIEMVEKDPKKISDLQKVLNKGVVEIVNGTFSQPFFQIISGESCIRQLYEGISAIEDATGIRVVSYATQEPAFCVQLPQLLSGFGYKIALLRTHWAPFGSEPTFDVSNFLWLGSDGSSINTVPRFSFLDYSRLMGDALHPGIINGGLNVISIDNKRTDPEYVFLIKGEENHIINPLMSEFVDVFESPVSLSHIDKFSSITMKHYSELLPNNGNIKVRLSQDDLHQTISWGLQVDVIVRTISRIEKLILEIEELDAKVWWKTGKSQEIKIEDCWRHLLLAQHHDLLVCGTWLSSKHGKPLYEVALELCRKAETAAHEIKKSLTQFNSDVKKENINPDLPTEVYIENDGTFSFTVGSETIVSRGGFLSIWENGEKLVSNDYVDKITTINENHWIVQGNFNGIYFTEEIRNDNYIDITINLDFPEKRLIGPHHPYKGYYADEGKKLSVVFPCVTDILIRDTPYYFEQTQLDRFNSLSWVGIEKCVGKGVAILSKEASGYYYDRKNSELYRTIAWAPKSWLYDSDDSFTRNGSSYTPIIGQHSLKIALVPYNARSNAARNALAYSSNIPAWPIIKPNEIVITALFIKNDNFYFRVWNPVEYDVEAEILIEDQCSLFYVNLYLEDPIEVDKSHLRLRPWGIQTFLVKKG